MEQGQEEMRVAQERFEKEAKEGGELPLEDSKEDGTVEKGERARLESAPKGLPQIEGDKEGKTATFFPCRHPASQARVSIFCCRSAQDCGASKGAQ